MWFFLVSGFLTEVIQQIHSLRETNAPAFLKRRFHSGAFVPKSHSASRQAVPHGP